MAAVAAALPSSSSTTNPLPELSLDLYNFDTSTAQSCPYVLTSPRSLEACSRLGVKPIDLLPKSLEEFQEENANRSAEEIAKSYKELERRRMSLLSKCQSEREYLIWQKAARQRSLSLSPTRPGCKPRLLTATTTPPPTNEEDETKLGASNPPSPRSGLRVSRRQGIKKKRPGSWSTPASPQHRRSRELASPLLRVLSPSRIKMLPPKDVKLMEMIVKKYEKETAEEQRKAEAWKSWEKEKEERQRQRQLSEKEKYRFLALKNLPFERKSTEEENQRIPRSCSTMSSPRKSCKNLGELEEDSEEQIPAKDLSQRLHDLQLSSPDGKQFGDQLDHALGFWKDHVALYQEAANLRVVRQVALRRRHLRRERLLKESEHRRKMAQLEAQKEAKIRETVSRIQAKEHRAEQFARDRAQAIQQSRASAQAASDLRDLLKQKLDKDSFYKKSQRVEIEARFHRFPSRSLWDNVE